LNVTANIVAFMPSLAYISLLQTVKCLLIVPNAESALNEEAGKLLLEQYEYYSQRAKMMTEIHALVRKYSSINSFS
jgi:ubiquitin-conjugating enzyme E2 S